ncbi:MAG: group 1 truncated hemoglobin [Planctomycetota bacterium]
MIASRCEIAYVSNLAGCFGSQGGAKSRNNNGQAAVARAISILNHTDRAMTDNDELFEKLGGELHLKKVIEDFCFRAFQDAELAPYLADIDTEQLGTLQYQFLAAAFDGPFEYTGAELTAAFAGRGIHGPQYARVCGHFADAMEAHGIEPHLIDQALGRLAIYKDRVTGDTNVDG